MIFFTNSISRFSLQCALFLGILSFCATLNAQSTTGTPSIPTECQNITNPGSIDGDQVISIGEIPAMLGESAPAMGGAGELRYLWMEFLQLGSLPGQWYPILSATAATYQPGPLRSTRQFMRCVSREGCNTWIQTNIVTVTVSNISM